MFTYNSFAFYIRGALGFIYTGNQQKIIYLPLYP